MSSPPAYRSSANLQAIVEELNKPVKNSLDIPPRVELCREVLGVVDNDESPTVWSDLHNLVANYIAENPEGSRAENLEEAIADYLQALKIRTRQGSPKNCAETQNNFGLRTGSALRASSPRMWNPRSLIFGRRLPCTPGTPIQRGGQRIMRPAGLSAVDAH